MNTDEPIVFSHNNFKYHILNEKNILITAKFINKIFKTYNFDHKVKHLENFQQSMVHVSYKERTSINDKTGKLLKDVMPISEENYNKAIPLQKDDYERLEFLGDSFIRCFLGEYLYHRYTNKDVGFLTKFRSKLEKAETLSLLSKKLELHKYAIVARNIEQANGRLNNTHLTEDIFEAFFGALTMEFSETEKYMKCKELFINIIQKELDFAELINNEDNYKDRLMQYFHKQKWGDPKYFEDINLSNKDSQNAENRIFVCYVKDNNNNIIGAGTGDTKIKSEQDSAHSALIKLGVIIDEDVESDYYGEENNTYETDDSESDYYE